MIVDLIFIILSGGISGAVLEFTFRSIEHKKIIIPKIVNIQMYIINVLFLYLLYIIQVRFLYLIISIAIFTTSIEFITGYVFLKYKRIRLWDYRYQKYNFMRLVCPLYSILWIFLSLIYYFSILPLLLSINK